MRQYIGILIIAILVIGCTGAGKTDLRRLDRAIATDTPFADGMMPGLRAWMMLNGVRDINPDSFVRAVSRSEAFAVFYPDVEACFTDAVIDRVESGLGYIERNCGRYLPSLSFPSEVYGVVSPYNQSVMTVDTVMLVALNHYLGEDYAGYAGMAREQRVLKRVDRIAADVAEALIRTAYPFENSGVTPLVRRMLYEGAVVAAVIRISDACAALAVGVGEEDFRLLSDSEKELWRRIVGEGLLFSCNPSVADAMIKPVPNAGFYPRSARFMGWRVVEAAMSNGNVSLPQALSPDFYASEDALRKCGYAP